MAGQKKATCRDLWTIVVFFSLQMPTFRQGSTKCSVRIEYLPMIFFFFFCTSALG